MECNLYSERLSFSIKFYTLFNLLLTVCFFYPSTHKSTRFLYYFCLCKSFKELFLLCLPRSVSRLAGAKVLLFSEPPKLFETFFAFYAEKSSTLDKNQGAKPPTPYYIIYRREVKWNGREVKGALPEKEGRAKGRAMLISDKTMVVGRKMRTFAPY